MLIHSSTIKRQKAIILLISVPTIFGFHIWTQDMSQAYLHSAIKIIHYIHICPE